MKSARGIWILAEGLDGNAGRITGELLNRAGALADACGQEVTAVLFGLDVDDEALQSLVAQGADRIILLQYHPLQGAGVEPYAICLADLVRARAPAILIAAATTTGRTLMPYLAMKLHTGLTADCTDLSIDPETGDLLQTRPAIGGNIMATIRTARYRPQMATVRPHSMPPRQPDPSRKGVIERVPPPETHRLTSSVEVLALEPATEKRSLQDADVILSVGRGIRGPENLYMVRELADLLGAALGATRDVVDRGWLPYPNQIGLSGKTVTPRLYVAVGLSGSIQHLAGMQTSDTIVAINSDPDAQIFHVAQVGIVGDLFEVVPALIDSLKKRKTLALET